MKSYVKRVVAPVLIFIDILIQWLFYTTIQLNAGIQIIIPQDVLFPGAYVVYESDIGVHYFNGSQFVLMDENVVSGQYLTMECSGTVCDEASKVLPMGMKPLVAITGKLFENMSTLNFLACNTAKQQCNKVRYDILPNGTIDTDALLSHNSFFKNIPGIEHL